MVAASALGALVPGVAVTDRTVGVTDPAFVPFEPVVIGGEVVVLASRTTVLGVVVAVSTVRMAVVAHRVPVGVGVARVLPGPVAHSLSHVLSHQERHLWRGAGPVVLVLLVGTIGVAGTVCQLEVSEIASLTPSAVRV